MAEKVITITGLTEAMKMLKGVEDFLNSTAPMEATVKDVKERVLDLTDRGLDYRGRSFEPYSDSYKKTRKKEGLGTKPNLRVTGEMLDGMKAEVINANHGTVKLTGRMALIGQFHSQGGPRAGRPPKREFMDITDSGLAKIVKKNFDDPLMKIMGRR